MHFLILVLGVYHTLSSPMNTIPRFFVMHHGGSAAGHYLTIPENLPASLPLGFLKLDDQSIWSPRVKFAVEPSSTEDETLVHIRSCYNNKYWVVESHRVAGHISPTFWLVASADKPEEDRRNPACTLFSVSSRPGTPGVYFSSIGGTSRAPAPWVGQGDVQYGINMNTGSGSNFHVVDWETLVILPSQVTFRSEELDGNYLCSRVIERFPYHRFESGLDVGDPLVAHELYPTPEGNYRIKNLHFGKFWRRSPNWIWADADENNSSNDTVFSFVKISDGVIALRNLGNNNFCGGLTTEGKTDCLNAQYPTLSRQTRLMVEERVLKREISNIIYRLSDSRIYQEEIQEVSHAFATNGNLDKETTVTLTYSTSDSRTSTWTNSVSVTLGVTVTFETYVVPEITNWGVEVTTEVGYTHEWAKAETTERRREASYAVVVPPLSTIKVTLMCTKAACDVPFSYTQRDLLTSGETITTVKDDGIYTGINTYNFYFESSKVVEDDQGRIYV